MSRQSDLFGPVKAAPRDRRADARPVVVRLSYEGETPDAWHLAKLGQPPRWVPKFGVTRGEGGQDDAWTMPTGWARERGWL